MNKLMDIVHPGEDHLLKFFEGSSELVPLSQTCHKCMQPLSGEYYYKCTIEGCDEYYLHKECVELKDLPQIHHPLHPQHPLAEHLNYPCDKSFVCSFCGETNQSRRFYQCSDDECDFYLNTTCAIDFKTRPELLDKYLIQHALHNDEDHRLSPFKIPSRSINMIDFEDLQTMCALCGDLMFRGLHKEVIQESGFCYKSIACHFYLHIECAQVTNEVVQHQSHPQHPLVLHLHDHSDDELSCAACLKWIKGEFYFHCDHCPTFNLDFKCYIQFKPTLKHEAHEHPLAFFPRISNDYDVRCYACNTPCNYDLFRCFTCNFNIHSGCHALPITVDYYDHVDPLILTTSFKKDGDPTTYYCDICEKRRDPDRGIYFCKECTFIAHFECALSLSTAEVAANILAPWSQILSDDEEDMRLLCSDEKVSEKVSAEIWGQLFKEFQMVKEIQLLFTNKKGKKQLTEKLQEFEEIRLANTEDMLRRLKQSLRETNSD